MKFCLSKKDTYDSFKKIINCKMILENYNKLDNKDSLVFIKVNNDKKLFLIAETSNKLVTLKIKLNNCISIGECYVDYSYLHSLNEAILSLDKDELLWFEQKDGKMNVYIENEISLISLENKPNYTLLFQMDIVDKNKNNMFDSSFKMEDFKYVLSMNEKEFIDKYKNIKKCVKSNRSITNLRTKNSDSLELCINDSYYVANNTFKLKENIEFDIDCFLDNSLFEIGKNNFSSKRKEINFYLYNDNLNSKSILLIKRDNLKFYTKIKKNDLIDIDCLKNKMKKSELEINCLELLAYLKKIPKITSSNYVNTNARICFKDNNCALFNDILDMSNSVNFYQGKIDENIINDENVLLYNIDMHSFYQSIIYLLNNENEIVYMSLLEDSILYIYDDNNNFVLLSLKPN